MDALEDSDLLSKLSEDVEDDFGLAELYKSEYQPPPLSTKPVPPEICRLAVSAWHFGHVVNGDSLMDWLASHSWWQEVQTYS